jgi:hypothetical protein
MKISLSKTEAMGFCRGDGNLKTLKLEIQGKIIEHVSILNYLSYRTTNDNNDNNINIKRYNITVDII